MKPSDVMKMIVLPLKEEADIRKVEIRVEYMSSKGALCKLKEVITAKNKEGSP